MLLAIRESGPIAARQVTILRLAQGGAFDVSGDIALNTAHREGDGSDHADVATNSAFVGTGGYEAVDDKAVPVGADVLSLEDSGDLFSKVKLTLTNLLVFIFNRVAGFLNYQASKTSLTPADAATATVDVSTNYDYTITPSGASFTLALTNIPADGTAWSVTIYAINWDGVTVTMPAGSVTPGGSGLTFTSGGGKDRIIARGNAGSAGENEFYNLPGDLK